MYGWQTNTQSVRDLLSRKKLVRHIVRVKLSPKLLLYLMMKFGDNFAFDFGKKFLGKFLYGCIG